MSALLARRWLDLVVLAGLALTFALVVKWRGEQFDGYGLLGRYFARHDFQGKPFATSVDPVIDLTSDDEDSVYATHPRFSVEWTGTIVLPVTGRYELATESDDGSRLWIGKDLVVDNGGIHGARRKTGVRMLTAGKHPIRIQYVQAGAGGMMRISWQPGRRGVPEYIPPTVLFPRDPDEVDAAKAHSVPPRDLPAIVMLGLGLLLSCLVWGRAGVLTWIGRLRRERWARVDAGICLVVLVGAMAMRTWDVSAAGQTWDEDVYWSAGRDFVQNLLALDGRAESWSWNNEHPALAKWLYGPATLVDESFEPARMVAVLLGALACVVVFLAGRDLVNRRVGFVGAAFAAVLPHLVGHSKIIGLETPTALFFALAVWLLFRAFQRGGNSPYYLLAAVATGLALSTRLSNLSLLLMVGALYLWHNGGEILRSKQLPLPLNLGVFPLVAGAVFFGLWPYLWENPLGHMGEMLSFWKPDIYLEHFMGQRQAPPLYYFPVYFVATTPLALLPLIGLGLARAVISGAWPSRRDLGQRALLLWFLAPWVVVFSPMARDGVRYLIPALLASCVLAAAGADWVARGIARLLRRVWRWDLAAPALGLIGAAAGLQTFRAGLEVHPYYIDYYNEIFGGPRVVAERRLLEIAWWGEGLAEAAAFVSRAAPPGASVKIHAHPTHVVRLRHDLKLVDGMDADFVIYNNLFNDPVRLPRHRIAYVVRAAGAPLVWVYQKEREPRK